jgi:hypothetical protein
MCEREREIPDTKSTGGEESCPGAPVIIRRNERDIIREGPPGRYGPIRVVVFAFGGSSGN